MKIKKDIMKKSGVRKMLLASVMAGGLVAVAPQAMGQSEDALVQEYRDTLNELQTIREYNTIKSAIVDDQRRYITALTAEAESIEGWKEALPEVVEEMISGLEEFVAQDVPFRASERANRLENLRSSNNGAEDDASDEEKFIAKFYKTLEAVQIENDYGRSIESYKNMLVRGEEEVEVYFLMVGRVALYYQEVESGAVGMWDNASRSWTSDLPTGAGEQIRTAVAVAREEVPPDLLILPLPAPEDS